MGKSKRFEVIKKFNLEEAMFYRAFRSRMIVGKIDLIKIKTSYNFRRELINNISILYNVIVHYYQSTRMSDEYSNEREKKLYMLSKYIWLSKEPIMSKVLRLKILTDQIEDMWYRRELLETRQNLGFSDGKILSIENMKIDDTITSLSKKFIKSYKDAVHALRLENKFLYDVYGVKIIENKE